MQCPNCAATRLSVVMTAYATDEQIVRRRRCHACEHRWYTLQAPEALLPSGAFHWIERHGSRRTVKLIDPKPTASP